MTEWLRGRSVFQRVALALMVLFIAGAIASYFSGGTSTFGFLTLALIVGYIGFRKELLWRVRNRLLVTYFLFGVVPIFLIALSLMYTAELLFGQFATQRVRRELKAKIGSVRSAAQNLSLATSHGANSELLDGIRHQVPNLAAIVQTNGDTLRFPGDAVFQTIPPWIAPGFADLFESAGRYYIGANVRDGKTEAFAFLPLDSQILASLTPGVVSIGPVVRGNARIEVEFRAGSSIAVVENHVRKEVAPSRLPPSRGWWDVPIAGMLIRNVQTSSGKEDILLPLISRPSLLVTGGMSTQMTSIAISLLFIVGGLFLIVWKLCPCFLA
ncbi:MAG: hypothetical protein JO097_10020 [Acidobacteriaceae bacterium]|nr:hypothetical protein [Acidobacteriaceae bacterium]MBV9765834.1 hypothetical protein [Acidobacteriaceae bacterium]